jgi:phage terminase large subunit-like protein
MTQLRVGLTPAQRAIHKSVARFKVVAAGRRFGKTTYAIIWCLLWALATENIHGEALHSDSEVVYFGVDREQAKRNAWNMLKDLGRPVIAEKNENSAYVTLINGVRIRLMGMDNPDSARGMKIRAVVLDEYADMPEWAWAEIIRPALMDCEGVALFIGTPKGKNHFFHLYNSAMMREQDFLDWEAFNYTSRDNPTIRERELDAMVREYGVRSEDAFKQEIEARFIARSGKIFAMDQFKISDKEPPGHYFITVDLAGFSKDGTKKNAKIDKLDSTAIAIVKVNRNGWWVKEIQHGKWDVRETALRIIRACVDNDVRQVGIEKGALMNAVQPYMQDYMRQYNRFIKTIPLTHGNQRKWDRIAWSLQGRVEKGLVTLNPGPWNDVLLEQAVDFPDNRTHDDLLDALSYIDQIAKVFNTSPFEEQTPWEPLDPDSGY